MSQISPSKTPSMLLRARMMAGKRIARKYRGIHAKTLQKIEYKRLRDLVPWLRQKARDKKKISKVEVIENTIIYIDQLHKALAEKIQRQQAESLECVVKTSDAGEMTRMAFNEECRYENVPSKSMSLFSSTPSSLSSPLPSSSLPPIFSHSPIPPYPLRAHILRPNICTTERRLSSYMVQSNVPRDVSDGNDPRS